jgi:hypothetical protein
MDWKLFKELLCAVHNVQPRAECSDKIGESRNSAALRLSNTLGRLTDDQWSASDLEERLQGMCDVAKLFVKVMEQPPDKRSAYMVEATRQAYNTEVKKS